MRYVYVVPLMMYLKLYFHSDFVSRPEVDDDIRTETRPDVQIFSYDLHWWQQRGKNLNVIIITCSAKRLARANNNNISKT